MKKLMLICAPVSSRSGYGDHARDLVWSFLENDRFDIKIMDVRWGDCPRNALDENNENDKRILDCITTNPNEEIKQQPDIYVDIRIPQEFQTLGKFNIGITAGIETSVVSQVWMDGVNKMDLNIVPSEHSKNGFAKTIFDKVDNNTKQKIGELKLEKPMEVVFEGVDEDIYKPLTKDEIDSDFFDMLNEKVPEKFAFLFVGQWIKGGFGEDRKDIFRLIKTFYSSFANMKKQPALILKTSGASFSIMDKEETLRKIHSIKSMFPADIKLPNIYLLHGDLSKEEMNYLYNHPKVKCMVSFTHGEGFGRPLLEATMTGLPVMATNWSGQLDFLDSDKSLLLGGTLNKVPESAVWENIIIPESQWFTVDEGQAHQVLNYTYNNIWDVKKRAESLMRINREKFKLSDMTEKLNKIIDGYTKDLPTNVPINLPKLKKVEPSKIKLPKLKKVGVSV